MTTLQEKELQTQDNFKIQEIEIKSEDIPDFTSTFAELTSLNCGEIHLYQDTEQTWKYGVFCRYCQEKFIAIDIFCDHVIKLHVKNSIDYRENKPIYLAAKEENGIENEEINNETFSDADQSYNHTDDEDNSDENNADENITLSELKINVTQKGSRKDCHICGKIFNRPSRLRRHLSVHDKKQSKLYKCSLCEVQFDDRKIYRRHRETAHNKIKCPTCNKYFYSQNKLDRHIVIHSENRERNFQCDQCEANYFTKHSLNAHIKIVHLDIKKFKCKYCNKRFGKSSALIIHERIHTGERPYICELCGATFQTATLLTNHKKRHNNEKNYECEICKKKFFTHTYLRDHMVSHTKEKPHQCEICLARFTLRSGLNKHKQLHSNVKKYVCNLCGKSYAQNPGLYAHMKSHKIANTVESASATLLK